MNASTGEPIWQTFTIAQTPQPRGKNAAGVTQLGPAGAPIWTTPTIDIRRRMIYASTGNMYAGPQQPTSDAVMAFDLATGRVAWTRQMTPKDIFPCRGTNCLDDRGEDFDFGTAPVLTTTWSAPTDK